MLDLFLETMPRPHIPKQDIADLSRLFLMESVHCPPPRCGRAGTCATRVKARFKDATLRTVLAQACYTEPCSPTACATEALLMTKILRMSSLGAVEAL